jgi:hypothetical protein
MGPDPLLQVAHRDGAVEEQFEQDFDARLNRGLATSPARGGALVGAE